MLNLGSAGIFVLGTCLLMFGQGLTPPVIAADALSPADAVSPLDSVSPLDAGAENLEIALVRGGQPIHHMYCLPNDEADPAAVLALKEYRTLVTKATGREPIRVDAPVAGTPTIFFGRNRWSTESGVTSEGLPSEGFRIRSIGQDIHIVGRDTPKVGAHQVAARVGMEPGTLFGTYEFLERYYAHALRLAR